MRIIRVAIVCILFLVALNALVAGYLFMSDPSGAGLHITVSRLQHSPFTDYFIPGLVLFFAIGILGLFTAIITILNWRYYSWVIMMQGVVLLGWIVIQIAMLQELNFLHYIFITISALLLFFGYRLRNHKK